MSKAAERLLNAEPLSAKAFNYLNGAASRLKDWRQVDKAIQVRLQNAPDDTETTRLLAYVQTSQANYEKYREIMKKIIDGGKASSSDMNGYAWAALFTGKGVSSDDIEIARRGLGAANDHDFAIMHTLACLYAEVGKTKEARDLLVNALEVAHMDEPDESVWYGFGRIAEQYGEYGAAHDAYKRVESDETKKDNEPGSLSTLNLMLSRMKAVDTELRKTSAAGSL
jgi:tetratricopeptide (TPR) repeat protein